MDPAAGMVMIQAQKMRSVMTQSRARKLLAQPTPMMAVVIEWVVETGMPRNPVTKQDGGPGRLRREAVDRFKAHQFVAEGLDDLPATDVGADGHGQDHRTTSPR